MTILTLTVKYVQGLVLGDLNNQPLVQSCSKALTRVRNSNLLSRDHLLNSLSAESRVRSMSLKAPQEMQQAL